MVGTVTAAVGPQGQFNPRAENSSSTWPQDPVFDAGSEWAGPRHHFFAEPVQFRLKVQGYSKVPSEFTVQRISFDRDVERYQRAAELGLSHCAARRSRRVDPDAERDEESLERSQRRAKQAVRRLVTELAPSALVTFTTRQVLSLDALIDVWQRFNRLVTRLGGPWEYVAVPEPHPSNPDHLHIHAAVRGKVSINSLRRLWHIALEGHFGRRVAHTLRGALAPGNIDVQAVKGRDQVRRIRKIARYISKYITKGLIERFNRRRYWPSKGISLEGAKVFWLASVEQVDALREACELLGQWDGVGPSYKIFRPCDRVAWWCAEPGGLGPPF